MGYFSDKDIELQEQEAIDGGASPDQEPDFVDMQIEYLRFEKSCIEVKLKELEGIRNGR